MQKIKRHIDGMIENNVFLAYVDYSEIMIL